MRTAMQKIEELIEYIEAQYGWEGSYTIRPDHRIDLYFYMKRGNVERTVGTKIEPEMCSDPDFIRRCRNCLIRNYHQHLRKAS